MIQSRHDYIAYLEADRVALGRQKPVLLRRLGYLVSPDYIWLFQRTLRGLEYFGNVASYRLDHRLAYLYLKLRYRRLAAKLALTIPVNVFGPGLAIVHYGSIVVNENARVGANCRIHPGTNIGASAGSTAAPQIGDNVYLAPGAKVFGDIRIASNTAIGANAVVTKSFLEEHSMLAGVPARAVKRIDIRKIIGHLQA